MATRSIGFFRQICASNSRNISLYDWPKKDYSQMNVKQSELFSSTLFFQRSKNAKMLKWPNLKFQNHLFLSNHFLLNGPISRKPEKSAATGISWLALARSWLAISCHRHILRINYCPKIALVFFKRLIKGVLHDCLILLK